VSSAFSGEFPETASIRAEGDSLGHTAYLSVEATAIARSAVLGRTEADKDRVMRYLVGLVAGPAAQAMKMRGTRATFIDADSWAISGGVNDCRQFERVMGTARRLISVDMEDIVSEAFDLLEEPGVWHRWNMSSRTC
jgi:hypothetical protein